MRIPPKCGTCVYAVPPELTDTSPPQTVVCRRKGERPADASCLGYKYDILKRFPSLVSFTAVSDVGTLTKLTCL